MSSITFTRAPYNVTYYKDGQKQTIRRVPPEKVHDILPEDTVILKNRKNEDFQEEEEYRVRHINPRHPNVLQIEDDDGNYTFVSSYDTVLEKAIAPRKGVNPRDLPERNKYLLWP